MLVKFFKRGTGHTRHGGSVQGYLLDEVRLQEGTAKVLRGDPVLTTAIIDSLDYAKTYTSGCLSFTEQEQLDEAQKQAIMDSFEQTLLPSLDADQYQCYWVQHTDKGRLELNFVMANVELLRGTAMTVYNHRTDKQLVDTWKDLTNLAYGLDNPNDPRNRRNYRASELNGQATAKTVSKKDVALSIGALIDQGVADYRIRDRHDVIQAIQRHGYVVVDDRHPLHLKIANPDKTLYRGKARRPIKLEGDYFRADFTAETTTPNARAAQSRDYHREQHQNIELLQARYEKLITHRKERLQTRYKRLQCDDFGYQATYLPPLPKKAAMRLFEAFHMSATGMHTYPENIYTPITTDYEDFIRRYQIDNPHHPLPLIVPDEATDENISALNQLCKTINRQIQGNPGYLETLFSKDVETVLSENRRGLDEDQLLQLRQLAGIALLPVTEKPDTLAFSNTIPRNDNDYGGPSFGF